MRFSVVVICLAGLAACAPTPPVDRGGESYRNYIDRREAELRGTGTIAPPGAPAPGQIQSGQIQSGPIGAAPQPSTQAGQTAGPAPGSRPRGDAPIGIAQQSGELRAAGLGTISDEQDFEAVSERESIESDRARLEQLRAQYQQIAPRPVPQRSGNQEPNVVRYALSTTNRVGEQVHRRLNPLRFQSHERNCAAYPSADQAQLDFLRRGGPERDPLNLDPNGDGFACSWNPAPFRAAVNR